MSDFTTLWMFQSAKTAETKMLMTTRLVTKKNVPNRLKTTTKNDSKLLLRCNPPTQKLFEVAEDWNIAVGCRMT